MAEIALGFRNLTVTSNGTDLLSGVSGYVDRGCITAVLGASAAGKSVLLQTLSGRIQNLEISGDVYMDGSEVDPKALGNPVAYVPQEDSLIGDLTAREVATNTALFKRNDAREKIDADVSDLLDRLGLTKVADGIIGTLIFRGLSGGQKKRAEIATELIAAPSILLLDEPTSGLDSKVAYDVLSTIRNIVKASNGMISVMLVIHQPNDKILSLFDHIMFLENGNTTFFGTLPQSLAHFSGLGFPCPSSVTPTDYFLQITDKNFSTSDCDFRESYQASEPWKVVDGQLADYKRKSTMHTEKSLQDLQVKKDYNANKVTFWKQVYVNQ
jgi:ABC-type multidrug transport system ATPase subunit